MFGPIGLSAIVTGLNVLLLLQFSDSEASFGDIIFGSFAPTSNFYLLSFVLGALGCFVTIVTQLLNITTKKPMRSMCMLLVTSMIWDLVALGLLIKPTIAFGLAAFYATLSINAAMSSLFIYIYLLEYKIHENLAKKIALQSLLFYLPGFVSAHFDNLLPIRYCFNATLFVRFTTVALTPFIVSLLKLKLESIECQPLFSVRKLLQKTSQLFSAKGSQQYLNILSLASGVQAFSIFSVSFHLFQADLSLKHLAEINLIGPFLAAIAWHSYFSETKLTQENQLLARLNSDTIKRFIRRYKLSSDSWATTTGIRTSSFTIDHDPDEQVLQKFPATLIQIRREEIDRCIEQVIGAKLLHKQQVGNQVIGIVDSETTMNPCVEVLMLFTCIYLDATPLVERRLKALAALFPILDPELSKVLTPHRIDDSLARVQWIFHFDYDWVDQQMVTTPGFVRYGVNIASLRSHIRFKIMEHLKNKHYLGNFIWVGEQARQQLLLEAPFLSSVIEACPLAIDSHEEDTVIFIIKFEELIPRMQRYYPLENLRSILNDYEPTTESRAILKVVEFQIANAKSVKELLATLNHLTTQSWSGFKEKDMALRLTLQAYWHASELLAESPEDLNNFRQRCLSAIEIIGYPSQMLHDAEMTKRKIRSTKRVIEIIRDATHERFTDTWIFLASNDMSRYGTDDLQDVLQEMIAIYRHSHLRQKEIVKLKFIPAYFNVCRHLIERDAAALAKSIDQCAQILLQHPLNSAHLIYFLDAHSYLQTQTTAALAVNQKTFELLKARVLAATGAEVQLLFAPTLQIRWKSYERLFSKYLQGAA